MAVSRKGQAQPKTDFSKVAAVVEDIPLENEIENSFLAYSYMVILQRAISDARDGMKPVHRRVLWSMLEDGYTPDKNHVKSAKIIGNVTGNYHTFGDAAAYGSMARLAQGHSLVLPLIDPHGNFGAPGSEPAASRYTEARLSKAAMQLLADIKEDAVPFRPNYDSTRKEPDVLPVRFPNALINGGSGIAVGMATNMPGHNPDEVMDAARWLLTHPTASLERLMEFIPGPDFPTGAQIIGTDGIKEAYETGRGKFRIRAKWHAEPLPRGRQQVIFTEIPYEVNVEGIIEEIKTALKNGKLQGLSDVKDLSDRIHGTRLVIDLKAGVNLQAAVAELFAATKLEVGYGINNVVIHEGEPRTAGLKELLEIFLAHRVEVVTRRSAFRKAKKAARLHLVEGMLKALASIDDVIKIIRAASDASVAQAGLMKKFKVDEVQADYILSIPLRRLTKFDTIELGNEKKSLVDEIKELDAILNDEKARTAVIAKELEETKKIISVPRRSEIVGGNLAEHLEATKQVIATANVEVEDEPCFVNVSAKGGLVRTSSKALDRAVSSTAATTRGKFVAYTNKGRGFRVETIHVGTREAAASAVLPSKLDRGERVIAVSPVELGEGEAGGLAMGTVQGAVKVVAPGWPVRSDEFQVISLADGDEILNARWVVSPKDTDLVFVSSDSSLLTFTADKVRPSGLSAAGVAGIKLAAGATVVGFDVVLPAEKEKAMLMTTTGKSVKATPFHLYPGKGRATGGVRSHKFLKGEESLVLASVSTPARLLTAEGVEVPVPETDNRRDGSGKPLEQSGLF